MPDDLTNLDDPSARYGLDHASTLKPPAPEKTPMQRRLEYAQRTGTPIDDKGRLHFAPPDQSTDTDPQLVGKSPDEIARILSDRESHREGCDDPACKRCNVVDDRTVRGNHRTHGGGSGGGRRRRKKAGGGAISHAVAHVNEDEIERDRRPCNVAGRVSIEANRGLYGAGNPSVGEMLDVLGRALYRGASWERIAAFLDSLT